MKGTIIGAISVIVILVVVGLVLSRSAGRDDLASSPAAEFESVEEESARRAPVAEEADPASSPSANEESSPELAVVEEEGETIVSMDEAGFSPQTVTISAGTIVTFVNNGQALHWPASDIHPTHQILPEFDAKRGLATGETYSFTFTESGRWSMHDHLNPSATGTIVVE